MRDIRCTCGKVVARIGIGKISILKENISTDKRLFEVKCSKCKKVVRGTVY